MYAKDKNAQLTSSQVNQSEAGPDIVDVNPTFLKNTQAPENNEELNLQTKNAKEPNSINKNGGKEHIIYSQQSTNPAIEVLDRLISLSPSSKESVNSYKNERNFVSDRDEKNLFKLDGIEQTVLEIELEKLHNLLLKQEKTNQEKVSDYETHLTKLTGQTCILQDQLKQAEDREKALVKKVNEQSQNHVQLSIVMQEYEKLISKLTAEIETEKRGNKEKIENLTAEKDSALQHLTNVEAAFTDVHQKYEKCKKVIEDYKKNEAKLKSLISDQIDTLKIKEKQLETIQVHASKQLENAHIEVERSRQNHEQEMTRLRALLRKTELKVMSLQESLEQKIKENQELTTICDDLIEGKVPPH